MHHYVQRTVAAASAVVLLALGLTIPGAAAGAASGDEPTVLHVGVPNDLTTTNSLALRSTSDWNVATTQYDMMLMFGNEDLSASSGLADSCEPNNDRTVWTCAIREDVTWSDGEPFTSKDIKFTYDLIIDQDIAIYTSYFSQQPKFETPDDQTLIWRSPEPTTAPLSPPWIYILPEHIWKEYADLSKDELKAVELLPAVTTGPYYLSDVQRGQNWTLTKNPEYWGDEPYYDEIRYQLFTNQDAMAQALKNGEIDVAGNIESALLPALDSDPNITVQRNVSDWWLNMAFNFGGQGPDADPLPALQDKTLRTAIAMAIDKQGIIDRAYDGAGNPGDSTIHQVPEIWHYNVPEEDLLPHDPDAANAMLDDAGYDKNTDGIRVDPATGDVLKLRMPVSQETAGALIAGQLIKGYLAEIGVDVELLPVNEAKMYTYWRDGNWDAYIWYWTGEPDPNYQMSAFTTDTCGDLSDGCWSNPEADALFKKQQQIVDPTERAQIVQQMQALIYEETPAIALAYPNNIEAYRNDHVQNFTPVPGPQGYLIPNYNNLSMVTVEPATGSSSSDSGSSGLPAWAWGLLAAAVAVGGVLIYRRENRPDDEEG